ncbi:hypothetical protein V8C86DRAFT_2459408, partial [Haematococcus lacustris]
AKLPEPMANITGSRQPPLNLPGCTNIQPTPSHEANAQYYFAPDGTAAGGSAHPMPPIDQTATSLSQPSILTAALKQARDLQQWLLRNPHNWDAMLSNKHHHSIHGILQVMAQPALQLGWQHGSTQGMVPVVCAPCEGQGSSSPLPPPFIANFCYSSGCGILWKEPDWPWSSIAGQWHSMEWAVNGPQGQLVLGPTRAAAAPAAASHPGPSLRQPACTGLRGRPGRASGAGPVASIYDFVMPPREAASAEPAVKPAMDSRPAGRTPPASLPEVPGTGGESRPQQLHLTPPMPRQLALLPHA